jgi:histidinol dehydrogenase
MTTTNEKLRNVAEIAAKIMMGEKALHPNQQKLDVHEPEKDELTADDFKKLRAGKKAPEVKKEEVEQIQEMDAMLRKRHVKSRPLMVCSSIIHLVLKIEDVDAKPNTW